MKTNNERKEQVKTKLLLLAVLFIGCAEQKDSVFVEGEDGISMGIDILSNAPSCTSNGITVRTFVDTNRNGELDASELVKKVSVVCNGVDGDSVSLSVATSEQCAAGGVVVDNTPICNGIDGSMGPQGPAGLNTVSGVVPVQLCPGDTASFKEQGLIIAGELFAVYHNNDAGHTFLAKLSPGNYITTNGSNCRFTYANNSGTVVLTSTGGNVTVPVPPPVFSNGTCVVQKIADYGREKHYSFNLAGSSLAGDFRVEINMNNNSMNSATTNNNGGFSFSAGLWSFAPINGATSFTIYTEGSALPFIQTAKVVQISNPANQINCTVNNTIN